MRRQRWLAIWLVGWPIQRLRQEGTKTSGNKSNERGSSGNGTGEHGNSDGTPDSPPASATPESSAASEPSAEPDSCDRPAIDASVPVVIWSDDARTGRRVLVACPISRRSGVRRRMPLHEAAAFLADTGAVIERHDAAADRRTLHRLADELLLDISPLVAIEPQPERVPWAGLPHRHSEILLVNITGIGEWFGGEPAVVEMAQRVMSRNGFRAAMAIADTPAAAWGMARFGGAEIEIVPEGDTVAETDRLPVRSLRITDDVAHQLARLGVETVGQLRRLPRSGLATRLGIELVRRMDQMAGVVEEPLVMYHTDPEESAVSELEYPTTDPDILRHRIGLLIDEVAARLAGRVRGALRLSCRLELLENHPPKRIDVGLFAPTADADHLKQLMATSMDGKRLDAMVHRVTIAVDLAGPLRQYQATLFGDSSSRGGNRQKLARMIETLATRLGGDAVLGVVPTEHPRPELAFGLRPLAGQAENPGLRRGPAATGKPLAKSPRRTAIEPLLGPLPTDPLRRPLILYRPPRQVEVVMAPEKGELVGIRCVQTPPPAGAGSSGSVVDRIVRHWGPERVEIRNLADGYQVRDYYKIELENGCWLWLFRLGIPKASPRWYLHGHFG
jgi:protein ImuB